MSTHKFFDRICYAVFAVMLLLTVCFVNAGRLGVWKASSAPGYESRLFDGSYVHTIDLVMEDWENFIENCKDEEYVSCAVVIDDEPYQNVAIRAKGNTSLTQVEAYGNNRYSFKLEFDHYDSAKSYYGLDKLCLNNIIQDNTYMKDYLAYQMMAQMGVSSPLCSYAKITVNGEEWGLYLAVEGVEESFLRRNYGNRYGKLYKPDSMDMGGGRGNGKRFDMDEFGAGEGSTPMPEGMPDNIPNEKMDRKPEGMPDDMPNEKKDWKPEDMPDFMAPERNGQKPQDMTGESPKNRMDFSGDRHGGMVNSSDDVLLRYIDDEAESYPNIFENAKTDVSDSDKTRLIQSLKRLGTGENLSKTVDIEKVIRYFAVHNFVLNFDSYTGGMIHNYYLYEKNGRLEMIPWDYNLAFGGFEAAGDATELLNMPIDSPVSGGDAKDRPMLAWIFEKEEYTDLYHAYVREFLAEWFDSGEFEKKIDEVSSMIAPYVKRDPTKFCTFEEFETGVSTLKEFCLLRAESVKGQLDGSIGSTKETQESGTLIDAGDLKVEDMGSMNHLMGKQPRPRD